jgi:hypothetical protein
VGKTCPIICLILARAEGTPFVFEPLAGGLLLRASDGDWARTQDGAAWIGAATDVAGTPTSDSVP